MKLRCTIDTKDIDIEQFSSVENGIYDVDRHGVYHLWHGLKTYIVAFKEVDVKTCKHQWVGRTDTDSPVCYYCGAKEGSFYAICIDTDDEDEALANMSVGIKTHELGEKI